MPPGTADHAGPRWPVLALPVTVLIIAGLAGLLDEVTAPRWDGPLHGDPVAVGVALEIVLGIMLVLTIRRLATTRARAGTVKAVRASAVAVKLRQVLVVMLGAGMIAVGVTIPVGLHQHVFSRPTGALPGRVDRRGVLLLGHGAGTALLFHLLGLHLHLTAYLLYGLLALVFLGVVMLRVWWVRQYRPRPG